LENGSHVLCEKPLGATVQEAERMIRCRDRAGRFVAIGYQWSFCEPIQSLKADIMRGEYGKPVRLRTLVLWPRNEAYYRRNNWAGARTDGAGNWVLDSPVNNATAHYLHNMFYVLGERVDRSAKPVRVIAELYRANPIENFDTGVCRAWTSEGIEVLFYASHSVQATRGPEFIYEFDKGVVEYGGRGKTIVGHFADGRTRDYGDPQADVTRKLWDAVGAVRGNGAMVCGPEAAASQTLCMNAMQESVPAVPDWPTTEVCQEGPEGGRLTYIKGLDEALSQAYAAGRLPSEMGVSWAKRGEEIDLRDYRHYPRE